MTREKVRDEVLELFHQHTDVDQRNDYSGRAMFGERCFAIVCDGPAQMLEAVMLCMYEVAQAELAYHLGQRDAAEVAAENEGEEYAGLTLREFIDALSHPLQDDMGLQTVYYWPKLNFPRAK